MTHASEANMAVDGDGIAVVETIAGLVATGTPGPSLQGWSRAIALGLEVSESTVADLLERADTRVLVLYQSPWEAFVEACSQHRFADGDEACAWLREWRRRQERVLQDRELDPERVLLVNSARLGSGLAELRAFLGVESAAHADANEADSIAALLGEHAELMARRMEELGPDYWEIYESLESVALLLGREPEFRDTDLASPDEQLGRSLALWGDAVAARVHDRQAAPVEAPANGEREHVARLELENTAGARALEELRLENELMAHMIQQLQGELAFHARSNEELQAALEQATGASERARLLISRIVSAPES